MKTTDQLIAAARDPRLAAQPKWIQQLVHDLAHRMELEARSAEGARRRAEGEVAQARELLTSGPADSDAYMDLPRAYSTYSDEAEQRPLGRGTTVEFRSPDTGPGEGMSVRWTGAGLEISGINCLAVVPLDPTRIRIEAR